MKVLTTALLAAGLASLAACGGGAANNTAAANNAVEAPPVDSLDDVNTLPPLDANAPPPAPVVATVADNATDNAAAGNARSVSPPLRSP